MSIDNEDRQGEEDKNLALQERKLIFDAMKFAIEVGVESLRANMRANFTAFLWRSRLISTVSLATLVFFTGYFINNKELMEASLVKNLLSISSVFFVLFSFFFTVLSSALTSTYINKKSYRYESYLEEIKFGCTEVEYCAHVISITKKMGYGTDAERRKFRLSISIFPLLSTLSWMLGSLLFFIGIAYK